MTPGDGLQVLLDIGSYQPPIAGLPPAVRTARLLCREAAGTRRLVLASIEPSFLDAWREQLRELPWVQAPRETAALFEGGYLNPEAPLLELPCGSLPEAGTLAGFLKTAGTLEVPALAVDGECTLAAYYPRAALRAGSAPRRISVRPGTWARIRKPEDASRAQERLWDSLPRESDGYIARFDRGLSIALSKRLIDLPITPNQLTTLGLAVGLLGAALLAQPSYPLCVLGALLLWSCCILDGCDGEIARLKLLDSPAGARFDALADNAVHLAVFIAIPAHVASAHPGAQVLRPALALLSGFLLSAFWTWRLILRRPGRNPLHRVFERVASRDFLYLVLLLALARRLDWFLWAAAAGSHLFWAALLAAELLPSGKRQA